MDILKAFRIWVVYRLRCFLGVEREIAQIKRDITCIEKKNLDRDEQYPLEDKEALEP